MSSAGVDALELWVALEHLKARVARSSGDCQRLWGGDCFPLDPPSPGVATPPSDLLDLDAFMASQDPLPGAPTSSHCRAPSSCEGPALHPNPHFHASAACGLTSLLCDQLAPPLGSLDLGRLLAEEEESAWSRFQSWAHLESSCALLDELEEPHAPRVRILSLDLTTWLPGPNGTQCCSPVVEIGQDSPFAASPRGMALTVR